MRAKNSFINQKYRAKQRGIPFLISFEEWYDWWLQQGIDKNLTPPKKTKDTLCMCRFNDSGPYALNNIYCDTVSNNVRFQRTYHNPSSGKAIQTPAGQFPSRKKAIDHYSCDRTTMARWINKYPDKFYYL